MAVAAAYPIQIELDSPLEVARWRPLVAGLLALPLAVVNGVLSFAAEIVTFIAWFAILFTGQYPDGMFKFVVATQRFQWRYLSYAFFMRESYPPFDVTAVLDDPGTDPARLSVQYPDHLSRVMIFFKGILLIPHFLALIVLGIGAYIAGAIAFFAVIFTGKWPQGLRDYVVNVVRWGFRVQAYMLLMTDVYPPFSLT